MPHARSLATFSFLMLFAFTANCVGDWKDDIGFTQLLGEYGSVPDGTGLAVSQVESPSGSNYFPTTGSSEFTGKSFTDGSGGGTGSSGHANSVANYFYGNTSSISGGVTDITMYEVSDWFNNVMLRGTIWQPSPQNFDVQNHSWIGTLGSVALDLEALRRVDFAINQGHMTMTVGLNNGTGTPPRLLSHSYNAISVGRSNGSHSYGTTSMYNTGRLATDIVAPASATSYSTPMVGSAAALLIDAAQDTDSRRTETIRAIIMAGATKTEFVDWDRTTTRPLDDIYGAGELNIYNSYKIMAGGQFDGSTTEPVSAAGEFGYDYVPALDPLDTMYYTFQVSPGDSYDELSILLTWNMEIIDIGGGFWDPTENMANMDMAFYDSSSSFLGTLLDSSASTVDNKEHFYFTGLGPGTYTLAISTDRDQDFSVAWRASLNSAAVPEPSSGAFIGLLTIGFVFIRRRRQR